MTQDSFKTLKVRIDGHIAEIVLDQPATHNSVTHTMHGESREAMRA